MKAVFFLLVAIFVVVNGRGKKNHNKKHPWGGVRPQDNKLWPRGKKYPKCHLYACLLCNAAVKPYSRFDQPELQTLTHCSKNRHPAIYNRMCTDVNNFTDLHRKRNIGIQKMAERAGYDQPGDEYTNKHAKFGVDVPSPYQPGIPPLQQGYGLQPNPFQQLYRDDTNTTVVVTQPQTGTVIYQQRPPDYMLVSVLACLCCFWPTGICAIYYANEANNLASAGDYAGARRMSNNAKKLIITSVVIGIIGLAVYVALQVVVINESYRSSNSY